MHYAHDEKYHALQNLRGEFFLILRREYFFKWLGESFSSAKWKKGKKQKKMEGIQMGKKLHGKGKKRVKIRIKELFSQCDLKHSENEKAF